MTRNPNSRLRHPLTRLRLLLIILTALAVVVLADGVVSAAPQQQAMDDATLSSLSLSDVTLGATFDPNTFGYYMAAAASTVAETTVTATPTNSNATVVITWNSVEEADGIGPWASDTTSLEWR